MSGHDFDIERRRKLPRRKRFLLRLWEVFIVLFFGYVFAWVMWELSHRP